MVRKLHIKESNRNRRINKSYIKENAITDMRKLDIVNSNEVGRKLDNYAYNFTNMQDCKLVPIDRPRTYAQAKKSLYPIIGVKHNVSLYQGYNKPRLSGSAVYGIFGNDTFDAIAGDDRIRSNFERINSRMLDYLEISSKTRNKAVPER